MARLGVEYKDVERASRSLFAQGLNPSVQKVRDLLGTGSNTTIANHLKTWRESFKASNSPLLPQSVPDDLMNPLDEFWSTAMAKADSNYQEFKDELEVKLHDAELAKTTALADLEEKLTEIDTLQHQLLDIKTKLSGTEQQWHTLEGKHLALTTELNVAHTEVEHTLSLLKDQSQAFDTEREQLNQVHAEALKYERERSTTTEDRLLSEVDQLRQTVKNLETENRQHQKNIQAHQVKSHQTELALQQERTELQTENQQLNAEQHQRRQETEVLKSQLTTAHDQLTQSIETVEALRVAYEQSKNNEIKLINSNSQLKETIAHLQSITTDKSGERTN